MAGEHRIVAREARQALGEVAGLAAQQLPNEKERRPVRQVGEVITDGDKRMAMSVPRLFTSH
jgi:hypothetical protein